MARFYPVYVRRSDGKIEIAAKGKRKELNQPTDDQLDQKADRDGISDFYREVKHDEPKHVDWRRKLGGMLARELNWKDKSAGDNSYILVALPENYRLYEHVKKTEKDGKLEVKSKTHAGGENDRQDAHLYGHPQGRKKRFRSPNEFFPHLLWLCTDEKSDPDNCSCKICSPEDLENVVPGAKQSMVRPTSTTPHQGMEQMARPGQAMSAGIQSLAAAQPKRPTPLPHAKSIDQKKDLEYNTFMYRSGELVWFERGQAWGLGVILRRWTPQNPSANNPKYQYLVQSLSYPLQYEQAVVKTSHAAMRPWLAWSVPKFTGDGLNNLPEPPRYSTADWSGLLQGRYGRGDPQVDASILAAKMIDSTYTPFNRNKIVEVDGGVAEIHYDGIFLGAEKIWVGDPVRLTIGSGTDIMVVHAVIERRQTSAMTSQVIKQDCKLLGDIYSLSQVPHRDPQVPTPAATNNNPQLPQRLTEDLAYRNARSISKKGMASFWKLVLPGHRLDIDSVKGRWYEASLVLPVLQGAQFTEAANRGEIQESSLWMNSRGDCLNSNRPPHLPKYPKENNRFDNRREAFGRSLPPNAQIQDGIEPPAPANVDPDLKTTGQGAGNSAATAIEIHPKFETADDTSGQQQHGHGGFDEFMDLDGMDDTEIPGFGQDYGSQGTGPGNFF